MRAVYKALGAAGGIAILSACTGGQSHIEPPFTAVNPQQSSLQFRVGTANYQGTTYLNTVVTFRQANGLSATLFNTPTITGPAGFVVAGCPAASNGAAPVATTVPCTDNGTNHISGTPPTQPGVAMTVTTFNQTGGAFAYGFAPANATTGGTANYAHTSTTSSQIPSVSATNTYMQPIYLAAAARLPFMLGPPAVPDFHNPALGYPAAFAGYDSGFTMFGVAPVAGTYAFNLTVPSNTIGQNSAVFDLTATMATIVPLATMPAPVLGGGGGTAITVTVLAAPPGVTSRVIYVADRQGANATACPPSGPCFYAINAGTAAGTFSLGTGFGTGDRFYAWQVGANFDIVGDAVPNNLSPTPPLPAQTDVTVSVPTGPVTF
ncbi:MAG: hypothetical protein QOF71_3513 [Candidatus Eremiobacteraeota bacterium]|nr:hypothetical protein [Candidatus Eremiobacteraeota bacterium]